MSALASIGKRRKIAPLSLTPLIDVVFILLMFFMLTSSFVNFRQITLSSPTATVINDPPQPQFVMLTADNQLFLLPEMTLLHLNAETPLALDESRPVILRAESSITVQAIVENLTALKASGIGNVNLGKTMPEAGSAP